MNAILAKRLMDSVIARPETFFPKDSKHGTLAKVLPKHTLVMFFELAHQNVRVETTIDHDPNYTELNGWNTCGEYKDRGFTGGYQIGSTIAFYNRARSKRAEVALIDIQR